MPKISTGFKTIKIVLPTYTDSEVEIKTNVSMEDIMEAEKEEGEINKTLAIAERMILSWNFQDDKGVDLPITVENIKTLPAIDINFIFETITPYTQKKTPSATTK